jgi:hypothetical protein
MAELEIEDHQATLPDDKVTSVYRRRVQKYLPGVDLGPDIHAKTSALFGPTEQALSQEYLGRAYDQAEYCFGQLKIAVYNRHWSGPIDNDAVRDTII